MRVALILFGCVCVTGQMMVSVVVHDRDGHAVADLHKGDFQVFDKGKPRELASFAVVQPAPGMSFTAWLFDDAAIDDLGTLTRLRAAAVRQVNAMPATDRVAIFTTSCRVFLDFTDSHDKLREALSRLEFHPLSDCNGAKVLTSAIRTVAALPGQRSIVLISSGFSAGADAIDSAIRLKMAIHAMDVGRGNSTALAEISHSTGGSYVAGLVFPKPESFYLLGLAVDPAPDNGFHPLRVKLKDARKLDVQARSGYSVQRSTAPVETAQTAKTPPERQRLADAVENPVAARKPTTAAPAIRTVPMGMLVLVSTAPEELASSAEISSRDEPLSFHKETNLVLVPVVVRDAQGHAVGNLRKEDFEITDDGQRRAVARFSIQKTGSAPGFVAFLFDDVHLTAEDLAKARDAARRRIASLRAGDRVGIFTTSGMNSPMDFGSDRAKTAAALLEVRANPANGAEVDGIVVARDLVRRMSTLPGRRSIALASTKLLPDQPELQERAIHANVFLGDVETATPECIYTLGFAPEGVKPDGGFHALKVALKRPEGLTLEARRGYYAPKGGAQQEIESAVFSRKEIRDLPVELSTRYLKAGDEARLTVIASMDVRRIRFRKADGLSRNEVTVVSSLFDTNGEWIAGAEKVVLFRLQEQTRKRLEAGPPVTIRTVFNLKPGGYLVRLVARDAEGQQMMAQSSAVEIR